MVRLEKKPFSSYSEELRKRAIENINRKLEGKRITNYFQGRFSSDLVNAQRNYLLENPSVARGISRAAGQRIRSKQLGFKTLQEAQQLSAFAERKKDELTLQQRQKLKVDKAKQRTRLTGIDFTSPDRKPERSIQAAQERTKKFIEDRRNILQKRVDEGSLDAKIANEQLQKEITSKFGDVTRQGLVNAQSIVKKPSLDKLKVGIEKVTSKIEAARERTRTASETIRSRNLLNKVNNKKISDLTSKEKLNLALDFRQYTKLENKLRQQVVVQKVAEAGIFLVDVARYGTDKEVRQKTNQLIKEIGKIAIDANKILLKDVGIGKGVSVEEKVAVDALTSSLALQVKDFANFAKRSPGEAIVSVGTDFFIMAGAGKGLKVIGKIPKSALKGSIRIGGKLIKKSTYLDNIIQLSRAKIKATPQAIASGLKGVSKKAAEKIVKAIKGSPEKTIAKVVREVVKKSKRKFTPEEIVIIRNEARALFKKESFRRNTLRDLESLYRRNKGKLKQTDIFKTKQLRESIDNLIKKFKKKPKEKIKTTRIKSKEKVINLKKKEKFQKILVALIKEAKKGKVNKKTIKKKLEKSIGEKISTKEWFEFQKIFKKRIGQIIKKFETKPLKVIKTKSKKVPKKKPIPKRKVVKKKIVKRKKLSPIQIKEKERRIARAANEIVKDIREKKYTFKDVRLLQKSKRTIKPQIEKRVGERISNKEWAESMKFIINMIKKEAAKRIPKPLKIIKTKSKKVPKKKPTPKRKVVKKKIVKKPKIINIGLVEKEIKSIDTLKDADKIKKLLDSTIKKRQFKDKRTEAQRLKDIRVLKKRLRDKIVTIKRKELKLVEIKKTKPSAKPTIQKRVGRQTLIQKTATRTRQRVPRQRLKVRAETRKVIRKQRVIQARNTKVVIPIGTPSILAASIFNVMRGLQFGQDSGVTQASISRIDSLSRNIQNQASSSAVAQAFKYKQLEKQLKVLKNKLKAENRIKEKPKLRPKIRKKKEELEFKTLNKPTPVFNVVVKKRGKNITLKNKLTERDALNFMAYELDTQLLRSAVLKPMGESKLARVVSPKYRGAFEQRKKKLRKFKVQRKKKVPIRGFIEKQKYSLDTKREQKQLRPKKRKVIKRKTTIKRKVKKKQ